MSFTFIKIGQEYNEALLALSDLSSPGTNDFRISRRPDFFALSSELGIYNYYGIKTQQRLVAVIGVTEQLRIVTGKKEKVLYFHDLKVDPVYGGAHAYYRLVEGISNIYSSQTGRKVMFSVILESNENVRAITKGRGLFANAELLGKIVHTGFPLFIGSKKCSKMAIPISGEKAWNFYHSKNINFSFIDKNIFLKPNGFFLGIEDKGELKGVCKIIDQVSSRKIIKIKSLKPTETLLNLYCRMKGFQRLPQKNEVFNHACLSYYCTSDSTDFRMDFISYLRQHYSNRYSYIFTGLLEDEASKYQGFLMIKFNSNIYSYGMGPAIKFNFSELTLI